MDYEKCLKCKYCFEDEEEELLCNYNSNYLRDNKKCPLDEREVRKMMKVVLIHEDYHGFLGVAKDYNNAINFLLQNHWLNTDTEIYVDNEDNFKTLKELNISIEDIRKMGFNKFNELFDGIFYLDIDNVWGM